MMGLLIFDIEMENLRVSTNPITLAATYYQIFRPINVNGARIVTAVFPNGRNKVDFPLRFSH